MGEVRIPTQSVMEDLKKVDDRGDDMETRRGCTHVWLFAVERGDGELAERIHRDRPTQRQRVAWKNGAIVTINGRSDIIQHARSAASKHRKSRRRVLFSSRYD